MPWVWKKAAARRRNAVQECGAGVGLLVGDAAEVWADIHEAFLKLACVLISWRRLTSLR
ncbi:hypothetical protein [Nonomuraea soli]|uniref:Uncharacterized protein n=1 Tax=Nonomuraea soli TaxID=1032476 RepID=A0A7W0CFJ4_9ACTN|nr:hypothetical protein [Nonomuraea soli]MBA2890060.1 hypothetical protein [Nonomuraea soli]